MTGVIVRPTLAPIDHVQALQNPSGNLPLSVRSPSEDKVTGAAHIRVSDAAPVLDAHRYAWNTSRSVTLAAAGDGVKFLEEQNVLRNFLLLRNASATANLYLDFGRQADATSAFLILPGQMILFDTVVPQDDLWVYTDAANGILRFAFSTLGDR